VVGVHVVPGFTVRTAVAVPLAEAEMVSAVEVLTADVVTGNVALSCPAGTGRFDGTVATALLLERNTPRPPAGAALLRVTVPVDPLPPVIGFGLRVSVDTPADGGAVPHWPGTPPPPQTSPKSHPQRMLPPHPSGREPHGPPRTVPPRAARHVVGVQPPATVSRVATGAWPGAPELELIVTVVAAGTELEAWIVNAPPP